MAILVSDVGGTNTRIALGQDGRIDPATVRSFANDDFDSYLDLARTYLTEFPQDNLQGVCVAVAGPVSPRSARLTNREWAFDAAEMEATLNAKHVALINDLVAQGWALPVLAPESHVVLRGAPPQAASGGQALVVGLGTGFNICLVKLDEARGASVCEAELGHASMPTAVMSMLADGIGEAAAAKFVTIEHLFCGRGLAALHAVVAGADPIHPRDIMAAYDAGDEMARRTVTLMANCVGQLSREMIYYYMPRAGLCFIGGVSRSVLRPELLDGYFAAMNRDGKFEETARAAPVSLISDDFAALQGCAGYLGTLAL